MKEARHGWRRRLSPGSVGRALIEPDVGDNGKRHAALFAVLTERHPQLIEDLQVAARGVLELDADRHQPVTGVEFCQCVPLEIS
jgi:hypothetical protein